LRERERERGQSLVAHWAQLFLVSKREGKKPEALPKKKGEREKKSTTQPRVKRERERIDLVSQ